MYCERLSNRTVKEPLLHNHDDSFVLFSVSLAWFFSFLGIISFDLFARKKIKKNSSDSFFSRVVTLIPCIGVLFFVQQVDDDANGSIPNNRIICSSCCPKFAINIVKFCCININQIAKRQNMICDRAQQK